MKRTLIYRVTPIFCLLWPTLSYSQISNETDTRDVTIWFGTLTVAGAPASNSTYVQFSDNITATLANFIATDLTVDPRVRNPSALAPWITATSDMNWVLGAPQNLPAQANLQNAFSVRASQLNSSFGTGTLNVLPSSLSHAAVTYNLTTFDTSCGPSCFVHHIGNARVTIFEQDATWTAPGGGPPSTPVPPSLILALTGLAGAGLYTARRRLLRFRGHVNANA